MSNVNCPSRRAERRISLSIIGFLAVLCLGPLARAGDNSSTGFAAPGVNLSPRAYLTLAVGGMGDVGPGAMAAFTVGGEYFQLTARLCGASEIAILGPAYNSTTDFGLMAGAGKSFGVTRLYASAGLGGSTIERRGAEIPYNGDAWHWTEYERTTQTVLNVPIQLGLDFGGRYASAGLALLANLNTAKSYAGVMLTLNLGKLRDRS